MPEDKSIIIKNSLFKSEQAYEDAILNFKSGRYLTTLNRIYYSIFYTVHALGYHEGFITSKHSQLLGWFNKEFIYYRKVFAPKMFEIYQRAYNDRHEADYDMHSLTDFSTEDVSKSIENCKYFLAEIRKYFQSLNYKY